MHDILITGNNDEEIQSLNHFLHVEFKIKDLGPIHYFLGMQILREGHGIIVSQCKYALDFLHEFDISYLSSVTFPMDPSLSYLQILVITCQILPFIDISLGN